MAPPHHLSTKPTHRVSTRALYHNTTTTPPRVAIAWPYRIMESPSYLLTPILWHCHPPTPPHRLIASSQHHYGTAILTHHRIVIPNHRHTGATPPPWPFTLTFSHTITLTQCLNGTPQNTALNQLVITTPVQYTIEKTHQVQVQEKMVWQLAKTWRAPTKLKRWCLRCKRYRWKSFMLTGTKIQTQQNFKSVTCLRLRLRYIIIETGYIVLQNYRKYNSKGV